MTLNHSPLGKKSAYIDQYTADLLFPIARQSKRDEIHVPEKLPFYGYDLWNAYEISWLNTCGKPMVAIAQFIVPAESSHLIESKSLKLYFNSFNQTQFDNAKTVEKCIMRDLSNAAKAPVSVQLQSIDANTKFAHFDGICLDDLDVTIQTYQPHPDFLVTAKPKTVVTETLYSHLLKSNCLVTHQPDWGSIRIQYTGAKIDHSGLLKYLVSLRNHNEFHEQCVERIFMAILTRCEPTQLAVYARYSRRGGLDINPFRTTNPHFQIENPRLIRQ